MQRYVREAVVPKLLSDQVSIRTKTLALVGFVLLLSSFALYQIISSQQLQTYREIEERSARKDLLRVQQILISDLTDYAVTAWDWGLSTDTYKFAQDRNPEFIDTNLNAESLLGLGANFMIMLTEDGEMISQVGVDLRSERSLRASESLLANLRPDSPLIAERSSESHAYGLISDDGNVLLTGVSPILRSDDSGPSRGTLVVGRYLDRAKKQMLESRAQLSIDFTARGPDGFPEELAGLITTLEALTPAKGSPLRFPPRLLEYVDNNTIKGHLLFPDTNGVPVLLATTTIPRTIYLAGLESLNSLRLAMAAGGGILMIAVFFLLNRIVLRRLLSLEREVSRIGTTKDLSVRVNGRGKDELSKLGQSVNWMLSEIETSNERLEHEHARAEGLLLNILPKVVADQLKSSPDSIAESYNEVTILFADIVGFTDMSAKMDATEVVGILNSLFSRFDDLATELGLEKIKTIGDAYMAAAGLPLRTRDNARVVADMALAMIDATETICRENGYDLSLRIGINTGVVVAGVIGKTKFIYDLWGDAVNIASRMESTGEAGRIQTTQSTYELLRDSYVLQERGIIEIKGRGSMMTYFLIGKRPD